MRKFFLFLLLIINIFAQNYNEALSLYKNHQYKKAYNEFLQLCQQNLYQDPNLNFYLALSAEKLGKYNEAIAAFERILFYYPNNLRAKLELGKIYFTLHQYSTSLKYFKEALKLTNNKIVIKNINSFIKAIQKQQQKVFLNLTAMVSYGVDSNVKFTSDTDSFTIYLNNSPLKLQNNTKKTKTTQLQEALLISHLIKYDTFNLKNDITFYNSNYTNSPNQDLQLFSYSPSIIKNNTKYSAFFTYINYGHEPYLRVFGPYVTFSKKINNFTYDFLTIKYYSKKYIAQKNKKRNSNNYEIENKLIKILNSKKTLTFTIKALKEREKKHLLTTVNKNQYDFKLMYNLKLPHEFYLSLPVELKYDKYLDKNVFFEKKRKDKMIFYGLNLTKKLKKCSVQINFKQINNTSNIKIYEYHKWTINISIIKQIRIL